MATENKMSKLYQSFVLVFFMVTLAGGIYGEEPKMQDKPQVDVKNTTQGYFIDPAHSSISFYVKAKLVNVKAIFKEFYLKDFTYTAGDFTSPRGVVAIKPASVFTRDKKRDDHLRADDFFWVEKYPEAYIAVKDIVKDAEGYQATFVMKIRDKKKEYKERVKIEEKSDALVVSGSFIADRTTYDLLGEYLANKVMDDEVELSYKLVIKQKPN